MAVLLAVAVSFTQCKKDEEVQKATISGTIINSQTGRGLSNAKLSFCKPFTHSSATNSASKSSAASSPTVVFTLTTDSNGNYSSTTAIVGTYTVMIEATNYFTDYIDNFVIVFGVENTYSPVTVVQTLSNSALRIVLTWGTTPYDLDSHLTGPISGSTSRFHVYFSDDTYPLYSTSPTIILDVDDTSSFGPETTTINTLTAGTYRFSVHNYSDQTAAGAQGIKNSPAQVRVYGPNGLLKTYTPPTATATSGNTWVVFEVNVTSASSYTFTDKNTWATFTYSGSVTKK